MARVSALSSVGKVGLLGGVETRAVAQIGDEQWRTEVEEPTKQLALVILPTLSDGWGKSVGLVSVGWVCGGLAWYVFWDSFGVLGAGNPLWLFVLGPIALPVALAIDPATASSSCARLEDRITRLGIEDPGHARRHAFLKFLKADNKDQGL